MKHLICFLVLVFNFFSLNLPAQQQKAKTNTGAKVKPQTSSNKAPSPKITNDTLVFGQCKYIFQTKLRQDSCVKDVCKYYLDIKVRCPFGNECRSNSTVFITLSWKENGRWKKDKIIARDCSPDWNSSGGGYIGNSKTNPKMEYKIKHMGGYDKAKADEIEYLWR
jgi:hypothetical protein